MRPDGGDDTVAVTPKDLQDKAGLFNKASSDMLDLEVSLNTDATNLINEMSSVLNQSPDALQRFFNRWRTSLLSLSDAYLSISYNLTMVADGTQTWDDNITHMYNGPDTSQQKGGMRIR